MNLLKTILRGARLQHAWAPTQMEGPDTVQLAPPWDDDELQTQPAPLSMMVDAPAPARG